MSVNSINDLPTKLLVQIFSWYIKSEGQKVFTRNIPLVCKRWKDLHSNPVLWQDVNSKFFTLDDLNKLGEMGFLSSTLSLEFSYFEYANVENYLVNMMIHCCNLKRLCIKGTYYLTKLMMDVLQEQCPDIESLELTPNNEDLGDVLCPFLSVRGQNLKRLVLSHRLSSFDKHILPAIAGHCHALETLSLNCSCQRSSHIQFPINEIVIGCPKIQKLKIFRCDVVSSADSGDHEGFRDMVSFEALGTDFRCLDVCTLLKNSKELVRLGIYHCKNVTLSSLSVIPSDKLKVFSIKWFDGEFQNDNPLMLEVIGKWKHTLTTLHLPAAQCVVDNVLELYLTENPKPKLEDLDLRSCSASGKVLKKMISVCGNLQSAHIQKPCDLDLPSNVGVGWDWYSTGNAICINKRK